MLEDCAGFLGLKYFIEGDRIESFMSTTDEPKDGQQQGPLSPEQEKELNDIIDRLEAQHAKRVEESIEAERQEQDRQREQRQRDSFRVLVESTRVNFYVEPDKLAHMLAKHGFDQTEDGLRELLAKFPGLADGRTTRRFLGDVPVKPAPEKPKTAKDFPASKAEFKTLEQRTAAIDALGLEWFENLPLRPIERVPVEKMTAEQYRKLPGAEKTRIIDAKGLAFVENLLTKSAKKFS